MKRRSQDKQLKGKIPFVYYHPLWKPSVHSQMWKLRKEGKQTTIEQYDPDLGAKKCYFCPRCGYLCYRSPKIKNVSRSGDRAFFSHWPDKNAPICKWRTAKAEGKRYLTQEECLQAVEDGCLTIILQWQQRPSEEELLSKESSVYRGTVEKADGLLAKDPIYRHTEFQRLIPRKITTLQFIADHIDEFLGQDIRLPNSMSPEPFLELFIHVSELQQEVRQDSALYWGRADRVSIIKGYICISFGYQEHCVYFGILQDNASERGWTVENLQGKYLVVAGQLKPALKCQAMEDSKPIPRRCWQLIAKEWGAAGVVSERLVGILPHPTEVEWVEPTAIPKVETSSVVGQPKVQLSPVESLDTKKQVIADEQAVTDEIESATHPSEQSEKLEISNSSSFETLSAQSQPEQPITQQQSRLAEIEISNLPGSSDAGKTIYSFQSYAQVPRQTGSPSKASENLAGQPIKPKVKARFSSQNYSLRNQRSKSLLNFLKKVVKNLISRVARFVHFLKQL